MSVALRLVGDSDVTDLTRLVVRNRDFMAPWDAMRGEQHFTEAGQRATVRQLLAAHEAGTCVPFVILADGEPVGRLTLNDVVRGAYQSAHLGYWVDQAVNGRGIASAAVAAVLPIAFGERDLHRLQAATLLHNARSQRVLAHNGFTPIGTAPRYVRIAGRWQDHLLFQRLAEEAA